ncbi:cytochrome P450, partial [Biscogniauxia marginata]
MGFLFLSLSFGKLIGLATALGLVYVAVNAIYNIFFHPLRNHPGPIFWRISRIPYCYRLINGTLPFYMLNLHEKYGEVVRIAPNELAFSNVQAWKDIHGHRAQGQPVLEKWESFYRPVASEPTDIVNTCDREEHTSLRRQLAHGFSDRSMREQEPIIKNYLDLLISRLYEQGQGGAKPVNLAAWYNFTTFDVIGDLAFGESFGCLDNSDYHPWVKAIFQMGRVGTVVQTGGHYPFIKKLMFAMVPEKAKRERESHMEFTKAKLQRRLDIGQERPDLIQGLINKNPQFENLQANASTLIMAGSETTATLLSGVTYFLLTNRDCLEKLTNEVRSAFKSEDDINFESVIKLPYLLACLNEALRLYPPVPTGLPRVVPSGGVSIAGHYIPENTVVAIHQWAINHNKTHFKDAHSFRPQRWLYDPEFSTDHLEAMQPFHTGPRNCIGRNLAYNEMRTIIARLVWNFDIAIADESRSWLEEQKIYFFWEKGPLSTYLKPVQR